MRVLSNSALTRSVAFGSHVGVATTFDLDIASAREAKLTQATRSGAGVTLKTLGGAA